MSCHKFSRQYLVSSAGRPFHPNLGSKLFADKHHGDHKSSLYIMDMDPYKQCMSP